MNSIAITDSPFPFYVTSRYLLLNFLFIAVKLPAFQRLLLESIKPYTAFLAKSVHLNLQNFNVNSYPV